MSEYQKILSVVEHVYMEKQERSFKLSKDVEYLKIHRLVWNVIKDFTSRARMNADQLLRLKTAINMMRNTM